jgi:TP901 family phage tail tape measure protein
MNVFELFAKLFLDTSEYESGLSNAENMGSRFGSGIRSAARITGAAIAGATTAVVGFAGTSVRAGANFDSSMSQVAATMGTTVDQIQDLRDFAQEMGATTAFSATQAADALNYMALAGYDSTTSMSMLPNVLNLAAAGSIDLARASDMITDAQSALGLSLDETSTMVDQMAAAASRSNTSVEQLGDAFLTIGATASNLRGGTNELATVLGVLADNGIKGAEGGTHLRNMILSLTNPTNTAGDMLDELGIHVYDTEGNMRSMVDIIYDLQQSMEGMTQAEQDAAVGAIFNRADMASVNALLATEITRYDELSEAIGNSSGAAGDMANTQLDNLAGDITLFQSALEGAQIAISDALTPTLREFVQLGSEGLSSVTQAFQEGGLEGAMGALGDWLSDALSMIIDMTPDIIRAGMQLLGALGRGLVENAPMIASSILEVAQMLIDSFENAVNGDGASQLMDTTFEIITMIGDFLIENAPELIETAATLITNLIMFITDPANMDALINMSLDLIVAIADGLVAALPQLISAIPIIYARTTQVVIDEFPQILTTIGSLLGDLGLMIFDVVGAFMGLTHEEIVDNINTVYEFVSGSFSDFITGLTGWISDIGSNITGMWTDIQDWFTGGIDNVMVALGGWWDEISEWFSNLASNAVSWAGDMVSGFVGGIRDGIGSIGQGMSDLASEAASWIHFSTPDKGALADADEYMPDFIDLLAGGIDDNLPTIGASLENMSDYISNRMPSLDAGDAISNINAVSTIPMDNRAGQPIVVQAYFGNEKFDEYVVNSNQRTNFISGGRG